jgi:hypothetical protein
MCSLVSGNRQSEEFAAKPEGYLVVLHCPFTNVKRTSAKVSPGMMNVIAGNRIFFATLKDYTGGSGVDSHVLNLEYTLT